MIFVLLKNILLCRNVAGVLTGKQTMRQCHKMYTRTCASSEDSDQPAHLRSLIWIFTVRISDSQWCKVFFLLKHNDDETAWKHRLVSISVECTCQKVRFLTQLLQLSKVWSRVQSVAGLLRISLVIGNKWRWLYHILKRLKKYVYFTFFILTLQNLPKILLAPGGACKTKYTLQKHSHSIILKNWKFSDKNSYIFFLYFC